MIATDKYTGLSAAQARELLAYDPETGILTWKVRRGRVLAGTEAGFLKRRYVCTTVGYRVYRNHRLAWLIHYGEWPNDQVDHIDGDHSNNRIANLRQADCSVNNQNLRVSRTSNKLGVLGVCIERGKYRGAIEVCGRCRFLGRYDTIEEASNAYLKAKRELHEGNTL